jgi:hypothetical protein
MSFSERVACFDRVGHACLPAPLSATWHLHGVAIVEEYWSGVLRRLQAEVDTFNRLVEHQGEKGRENELSLVRLLEGLVPQRYGIGSGLLIDADGRYSKQMDIIVYDRSDEPALMAQTNQVLFPVENARLCIEVKTTVGKDEIEDAHAKHASVRELASRRDHPLFALLGYSADAHAATIAKHLFADSPNRVHFACVLQLALFAAQPSLVPNIPAGERELVIGVTPLLEKEGQTRVPGVYVKPPAGEFSAQVLHDGHRYPVVTLPDGEVLGEPSRALLLFCESLLNTLAADKSSVLSHYITEAGRDLFRLDENLS